MHPEPLELLEVDIGMAIHNHMVIVPEARPVVEDITKSANTDESIVVVSLACKSFVNKDL